MYPKVALIVLGVMGFCAHNAYSQSSLTQAEIDSISLYTLNQVTIINDSNTNKSINNFESNGSKNTDELIGQLTGVSLIKRGNYASEPTFRGMSSGQLSMTIDGMKIFSACTDKMDPISSYITSNNLSEISVSTNNSQAGEGSNIGGGLNFKTKSAQLSAPKFFSGGFSSKYETNGQGTQNDLDLNFSDTNWAINMNASYQKYQNYTAGGGQEIRYSQFEKLNIALNASVLLSASEVLKAQFIYDDALNVGYPALPMDVSFAGGRIFGLSYKKYLSHLKDGTFMVKVYGNHITHIMDDSKRDSVAIRMDMPGYNYTYGGFAELKFRTGKHHLHFSPDYYFNNSYAEMTMYPNNPNEKEMFMITWPDVNRQSYALQIGDGYEINKTNKIHLHLKSEFISNVMQSEMGKQQLLAIGFNQSPNSTYNLFNGSLEHTYQFKPKVTLTTTLGYAERQPTVTEGYGYYIYNSLDQFDYIGMPNLRKEKAIKSSISAAYSTKKIAVKSTLFTYLFEDYILGVVHPSFDGMTIGAKGVKVYENIPSANISGFEISVLGQITKTLVIKNISQFSYGTDHNHDALLLIPPLKNLMVLQYSSNKFTSQLEYIQSFSQNWVRTEAGETPTPAYALLNLNAKYSFSLWKSQSSVGVAIRNILDTQYYDHLDWNSISQPGRSAMLFVHVSF